MTEPVIWLKVGRKEPEEEERIKNEWEQGK